jgi:hypothetical protein
MTDERLAELERLCAAATPGPWWWDGLHMTFRENGRVEAVPRTTPNTLLVVESRAAIPDLITEVRRLRAGLAEIASYGEGPTVTGKFDEPTAARLARKLLEES